MINVGDVELLRRARKGDQTAFSELFAGHHQAIYRYAAYMCGREQADDVVQETFLAVLRQATREDVPHTSARAYLTGIARHRIWKRLSGRYEELTDTVDPADLDTFDGSTPIDQVVRDETIQQVRGAVESLPPLYREVVVLCELEEVDYTTAAVLVGCPVGTIRSRLHRAKALLVEKLRRLEPIGS